MNFELTADENFENLPSKKYINDCCIGGDEILNRLNKTIALEMQIHETALAIYQEDWGWALEFSKDKIVYLLVVSNTNELKPK